MKNLNAIHINSYFLSNKIHLNFYKIVTKYRSDRFLIPVYKNFKSKHIDGVDINYIFSGIDKVFFFTKVFKVLYIFYRKKSYKDVDYIHAHTLISDGIPAYILSLINKKKFVITVRGTDVNYFIERSSLFRFIAKVILQKASIVFFVSPAYKTKILGLYPTLANDKLLLLPNGVDDFWIKNVHERETGFQQFQTVNILFVGRVNKQKNLEILLRFLERYNDRKYNLTVVGQNELNWDFESLSRTIKEGNSINYLGEVTDVNQLLKIYRQNDVFVMLSPFETFGIVYIEALTQGLPIIYTRGDGIDGYFSEGEVGYACNHLSLTELKEKIDLVVARYNEICTNTTKSISQFDWEHLGKQYIESTSSRL